MRQSHVRRVKDTFDLGGFDEAGRLAAALGAPSSAGGESPNGPARTG